MWTRTLVAAGLACAVAVPAHAGEPDPSGSPNRAPWSGWYVAFAAGPFEGEETAGRLEEPQTGLMLGGTIGYRLTRALALESGLDLYGRRYTSATVGGTPPFGVSTATHLDLVSLAIPLTLRATWPVWRLEPYVGAGIALVRSELSLPASVFGLPVESRERDTSLGQHLLAGLDVVLTPHLSLGVEYRRLLLEGDFGPLSGGDVEIGGTAVLGTLRLRVP